MKCTCDILGNISFRLLPELAPLVDLQYSLEPRVHGLHDGGNLVGGVSELEDLSPQLDGDKLQGIGDLGKEGVGDGGHAINLGPDLGQEALHCAEHPLSGGRDAGHLEKNQLNWYVGILHILLKLKKNDITHLEGSMT